MIGDVDVEIPGNLPEETPGWNPSRRAGNKEVSFL
jgi:hypothetical protein